MNNNLSGAIVVGSGNIAKRHIRNIRALYPDAIVTCVSASGRRLTESEVGSTLVSESIAEALAKTPDNPIAIVASPASHHLTHAQELLCNGVFTLIEKPLCVTLGELKNYIILQHSDRIGVAYNLRFLPSMKVVSQLLKEQAIGNIQTAFSEVGQYLPDWRPHSDYTKSVSAQKKLGGGALLELSHELDYLSCFFGPFKKVLGTLRNSRVLNIDVEDNVDALLESTEGAIVHLHLDFTQRTPTRSFKAIGASGTIQWDLLNNTVEIIRPGEAKQTVYAKPSYDHNQMYREQLISFFRFSQKEEAFKSSLESGITVMHLIEAIKESSESAKWKLITV